MAAVRRAHAKQRTESDEITLSHAVSRGVEPPPAGRVRFADDPVRPYAHSTGPVRPYAPLTITLDSGCTFHMHHRREDLMHARPCSDVIPGLTEKVYCKWIGDLPITATDKSGRSRNLLVRDVRIAEGATDTL
eukprot:6226229-Prymnesium_polylepis.1